MFLGSPAQDNMLFCFHDKKCLHFFKGSTEKTPKLFAMSFNANSNMFNILLPILEYLSYVFSGLQTVFSITMRLARLLRFLGRHLR